MCWQSRDTSRINVQFTPSEVTRWSPGPVKIHITSQHLEVHWCRRGGPEIRPLHRDLQWSVVTALYKACSRSTYFICLFVVSSQIQVRSVTVWEILPVINEMTGQYSFSWLKSFYQSLFRMLRWEYRPVFIQLYNLCLFAVEHYCITFTVSCTFSLLLPSGWLHWMSILGMSGGNLPEFWAPACSLLLNFNHI
jgi:hypothetical protein